MTYIPEAVAATPDQIATLPQVHVANLMLGEAEHLGRCSNLLTLSLFSRPSPPLPTA